MKLRLDIAGQSYHVRQPGHDISVHLAFDGPQPNTYGVAAATAQAYRSGGWVGDVRAGGSCNFETYTLTPHCNGTHTECVGHITEARLHLPLHLREALIPATLVSVTPVSPAETADAYQPALAPGDRLIDAASLARALDGVHDDFCQAIVLRTVPNDDSKRSRDYMQHSPAFFSIDAMRYLVERGMQHLLTDLPSVDRLFDEGRLSAHHVFWGMEAGSHSANPDRLAATITELVYVPDSLRDGPYLLNLQTAAFLADAAPSRPFLYLLDRL
jgi:kynurenine formamidase